MGCCVSTNKPTLPQKTTTKHGGISKSPPPSHPLLEEEEEEEETVKEVLSETPTVPKPLSPPVPKFRPKNASPFIKSAPLLREKEQQNGVVRKKQYVEFTGDDASEASEILSTLSGSVSASTSVTEKRERNGDTKEELRELRQRSPARSRNRPFSGEMHREKTVGRSPGRRSEPSPGRVRAGSARRRESGDSSGRRSTSPGLGRTPSARKTGKSPGRGGPGSGDRIRKLDGTTTNESLENPLVSLECFIFL